MLHKQKLDDFFAKGGSGEAGEKKLWKEGHRLFIEAQKNDLDMPILFSAADYGSGLIYSAFLKSVELDPDIYTTKYKFVQLSKLKESLPLSSLRLKSSGKPLSDNYIRPYAICFTPPFVLNSE